jgi:hypothetical protein
MQTDGDNAKKMVGLRGLPANIDFTRYVADKTSPNPVDDIKALITKIYARMRPCDTFFLYISAHATVPATFRVSGTNRVVGNVSLDKQMTPPVADDAATVDELTPDDLSLDKMPACTMLGVIDACYSGSWIPEVSRILTPKTGLNAFVMTSSEQTSKSVGYPWWWPLSRTGSVFTSNLVDAWTSSSTFSLGPDDGSASHAFFESRLNIKTKPGLALAIGQYPQYWTRDGSHESCGGTQVSSCVQLTAPVQVAANFTNGMGACGANATFSDRFTLTTSASCAFTAVEASNGTGFNGSVQADGSFTATRGSAETMSGTVTTTGSASGTYSYTNSAGCTTKWQFTFSPG